MIDHRDVGLLFKCFDELVLQRVRKAVGLRKRPLKNVTFGQVLALGDMPGISEKVLADEEQGCSRGPCVLGGTSPVGKEVILPAIKQYELTNVDCTGSHSAFFKERSLWVDQIAGIDSSRCDFQGTMLLRQGTKLNMIHHQKDAELENGIFLGGSGSSNYYHWMIELLPKLQYLDALDDAYADFPLLVCSSARDYASFRDALSCFAGNREVIYLDLGKMYQVKRLVLITSPCVSPFTLLPGEQLTVQDHFFRRSVLGSLRDGLVSGLGITPPAVKNRLFFARHENRRNYNEDEIFKFFEGMGFRKVFMADHSLKEQIELMQSAEMLAGPTGAEWTNLIFCRKGTKGICWMNEAWGEFSCFSNLACFSGVELLYLRYKSKATTVTGLNGETYQLKSEELKKVLLPFSMQ